MALTRITKGVIKPNENYDSHNINSTGIVTAIGLDVNGNADISGNMSVGGVLTYEDVTSIDSVGIITARGGIDCNGDIDVDGHTNLDNVSIAGVTTVASDTSFIIGSNATSKYNIDFKQNSSNNRNSIDSFYMDFSIHDLQIRDESNNSLRAYFWPCEVALYSAGGKKFSTIGSGIKVHTVGDGHGIILDNTTYRNNITAESNRPGAVNSILEIDGKWNNTQVAFMTLSTGDDTTNKDDGRIRFFTKPSGGTIAERARIETDGKLNLYNDLDVDGHTNLDNVSIAGIITAANGINCTTDGVGNGINIGASQDLIIQHNGTNSFIDNNTGDLYVQTTGSGDDILIESADDFTVKTATKTAIEAIGDGAVKIYHNGSTNPKIYTNSIGVTIDNVLYISGPAGNPGRLRFQEGGALSEIRGVRNTDSNSLLYFDTEISGTTATRMMINGSGHLRAATDSTYDLGTNSVRWRNVYADTLYGDGSNLTGIVGVPSGCILLWSGSAASIPSGFVLCNGSNSTPDLRNKFVVGAYSDGSNTNWPNLQPGSTGGSADAVVVSHSHNHNLSGNTNNTGNHSHNVSGNSNNTGGHSHNRDKWGGNFGGSSGATVFRSDANGNRSTNNAGSHSHNISGNTNNTGAHSHNVSISGNVASNGVSGTNKNLPPYYALCYIMKT